jgi:hypothetical protein
MAVRQGVVFCQNRDFWPCLAAKFRAKGGFQAAGRMLGSDPKGLQGAGQGFGHEMLLKVQLRMLMDLAAGLDDAIGRGIDRV